MKKWKQVIRTMVVCLIALIVFFPILLVVAWSLMGKSELIRNIGSVLEERSGYALLRIIPMHLSVESFVRLFLDTPKFFVTFWNSFRMVIPILVGQVLIGMPAAWGCARYRFKGRKFIIALYAILMILPFQVTMVSSYLVLDQMHLMNTFWAIILPNMFSTFPIFIMTKFFQSIPEELLEAGRLEGASEWKVFWHIGIPIGMPGIMSALILGFLEYWNMIEQPLTLLRDKTKWPVALFLPTINGDNVQISLAASVVALLPPFLIFLAGQKNLEEGITTIKW